jgi:hypothetical protein
MGIIGRIRTRVERPGIGDGDGDGEREGTGSLKPQFEEG